MEKRQELYAGKAKSVYTTDDPDLLVLNFRDDTSAFDGKKVESLARKGMVNNIFNAFIMERLQEAGIPTHFGQKDADDPGGVCGAQYRRGWVGKTSRR